MRGYRPSAFSDEEDEVTQPFVPPDREQKIRLFARRARRGLPLFPQGDCPRPLPRRAPVEASGPRPAAGR